MLTAGRPVLTLEQDFKMATSHPPWMWPSYPREVAILLPKWPYYRPDVAILDILSLFVQHCLAGHVNVR